MRINIKKMKFLNMFTKQWWSVDLKISALHRYVKSCGNINKRKHQFKDFRTTETRMTVILVIFCCYKKRALMHKIIWHKTKTMQPR